MNGEEIRIGQGFDVHPYLDEGDTSAKPLVLGGVSFDGARGLAAHSDGDVIAHACTDAVLGAVGLGDIGTLFPDNDESLAGADSIGMLAEAVAQVAAEGWAVVNVDCTVVLDSPKISPNRDVMQQRLSTAVGAPVSVKGKRTEGMGGLQGGIHCYAVALVRKS